jgi:hypothetical protein
MFMSTGLVLPPFAFVAASVLVPVPVGMDGYVPAFLGGLAGAVVGLGLLIAGARIWTRPVDQED